MLGFLCQELCLCTTVRRGGQNERLGGWSPVALNKSLNLSEAFHHLESILEISIPQGDAQKSTCHSYQIQLFFSSLCAPVAGHPHSSLVLMHSRCVSTSWGLPKHKVSPQSDWVPPSAPTPAAGHVLRNTCRWSQVIVLCLEGCVIALTHHSCAHTVSPPRVPATSILTHVHLLSPDPGVGCRKSRCPLVISSMIDIPN